LTAQSRTEDRLEEFARTRTSLALWFGMIGGPAAGLLSVFVDYPAVNRACIADSSLILHLLTMLFLAVALLAGFTSWWLRARTGRWPDNAGGLLARSRFMTTVGLFASGIAVVGILMEWIPVFFIGACHGT
jgi:hypothetical protein